jgi:four helix bundle protein
METKLYLTVDKLSCYKRSFDLSSFLWEIVLRWDNFAKRTVGEQLMRAVDSISANIAEGFGRYSKKDKIKFYYIAYASVLESLDWVKKAFARKLLLKNDYEHLLNELSVLPKEIHHLIGFTNKKLAI